jgi:hypothetical protein
MVLARRETSRDAGFLVLQHENAVLRRQAGRVRYQPGDRLWLSALSRLIRRRRWGEVFAVTPATLLAWHRRLVTRTRDRTGRRRPGRPSTPAAIRRLVIRIAADNPTWGTGGCKGELVKLGHPIASSTGRQILRAAGIDPAPRRRAKRRSGRADGETRLIIIPDAMSRLSTQVTGASRLLAPHRPRAQRARLTPGPWSSTSSAAGHPVGRARSSRNEQRYLARPSGQWSGLNHHCNVRWLRATAPAR